MCEGKVRLGPEWSEEICRHVREIFVCGEICFVQFDDSRAKKYLSVPESYTKIVSFLLKRCYNKYIVRKCG